MASITKTFTAVAVLRLVDAHKLSLGTTLKECLGEAVGKVPNAGRITVSQLLDHSSGIYPTNNDMDYLTTVIGPKLPSSAQTQGSRDDRSNMKPDNLRRFMADHPPRAPVAKMPPVRTIYAPCDREDESPIEAAPVRPYSYGFFGGRGGPQAQRHFGYYNNYRQWTFR